MKKLKFTLMCAAASFAFSHIGYSAFLVGSIDPGSPADEGSETIYVQTLLAMGANDVYVDVSYNPDKTFTTFGYDAPSVSVTSYTKFDTGTPAPITGYQFVLGKFGNTSWVWELGVGETFTLPSSYSDQANKGGGLSHYSVFNGTTTRVPDGGTTIAMLGMALLGLGGARRFLGKL